MQNIWLVGIVLTSLLGVGTVMGIGAMNDYDGHNMMHGMHNEDCNEHEECEFEGDECLEHSDENCMEEHEDCDMDEHMRDHGC
jgi:hypothetical protein